MTRWLLSGHNTQESTDVARPVTVTMTESGLDAQISWFLSQLAGDTSDFDQTLKPTQVVQGRLYLNINYYARNMGAVMPFDPTSVGVPTGVVEESARVPLRRQLLLPWRLRRVYLWATDFYRHQLPGLDSALRVTYWQLRRASGVSLSHVWSLFEPEFYAKSRIIDRAHIVVALTITALDGILRQRQPQLLSLFVGQATATSLIGQRIWELRQIAEACGLTVSQMLREGAVRLEAYEAIPEAIPLVKAVRTFLMRHGHRGFRFEADFETERLADRPEHVLLALAGQLGESEPPEQRAETAREVALKALRQMNPIQRAVWRRILRWGQQLISWREDSKSSIAVRQAAYGLAARHLARHFYPNRPDDVMMFYTLEEFLSFVRSRGEQRVEQEILNQRRAEFDLHQTQPPPPELIWYDPATQHWTPTLAKEKEAFAPEVTWLEGIAASAGSGPAEGMAVVTNDPLEAGRRLLELEGPAVLVTRLTDPAWSGLFRRLSAVVTELGGVISHAAIVARENGLPAVVGVPEVTRQVRDGQLLRVDGARGTVEILK